MAALALVAAGAVAGLARVDVAAEPGPELGRPAPEFTLPDLAGKPVRLADFRGKKAVLVNFWATWCVPCREELPSLERLAQERRGTLEVLGVSLDTVSKTKVQAFVRELGLTFPILLDPGYTVAKTYRVRALPASFVIDRDGALRHREIGYRDWTDAESRYLVDEALRPR
ncbi:MAG TPA: TlpA disulfide reductase family protein [Methylomirabilota bacterium]|nr:TlpA disulfide reductase family protein [Methylomirabilota bacterium]